MSGKRLFLQRWEKRMKSLTDGRGVRLPFATTSIHVGQFQRFMKNKSQLFLNQYYPARIKLESKLSKNYLEDAMCTFHGLAKQWKNRNMEVDWIRRLFTCTNSTVVFKLMSVQNSHKLPSIFFLFVTLTELLDLSSVSSEGRQTISSASLTCNAEMSTFQSRSSHFC